MITTLYCVTMIYWRNLPEISVLFDIVTAVYYIYDWIFSAFSSINLSFPFTAKTLLTDSRLLYTIGLTVLYFVTFKKVDWWQGNEGESRTVDLNATWTVSDRIYWRLLFFTILLISERVATRYST